MRGNKLYRSLDTYLGQAGILLLAALPSRPAPRDIHNREYRKILVVKLAAMGDTILLTPAFRELRKRYPRAEIGMIGTAVNRDIVREIPHLVDRFYCLDVSRAAGDFSYWREFVAELREGGWEVGIDFDQWVHVTPILLRQARIPARIGFKTASKVRHKLYTHTAERDPSQHEAANFLELLGPLGIEAEVGSVTLPVSTDARDRCRADLRARGWDGESSLVFVHPGCGHAVERAWPMDSYRELCGRLSGRERVFQVFTGAGSERESVEALAGSLGAAACALTGMSLRDFIAYLSLADLVISGNTGAMHLAAGLGLTQIVLEGPNDPAKWGPINPDATILRSSCPGCPCLDMGWEFHRTDGYCMAQITVDEVYSAVANLLPLERRLQRAL